MGSGGLNTDGCWGPIALAAKEDLRCLSYFISKLANPLKRLGCPICWGDRVGSVDFYYFGRDTRRVELLPATHLMRSGRTCSAERFDQFLNQQNGLAMFRTAADSYDCPKMPDRGLGVVAQNGILEALSR